MRHLAIFVVALGFALSPLSVAPAFAENDRYELEVRKGEAVHRAFQEQREARLKKKAGRQRAYEDHDEDWGGWPAWFGYDWYEVQRHDRRHGRHDHRRPHIRHVKHERHDHYRADPYDPSPRFAHDYDDDYDDDYERD